MDSILSTIQTQVLIARRDVLNPSWFETGRRDPFNRLYYIESGSGFITHHGHQYLLRPGRLYLIPANAWHQHGCQRQVTILWTHFTALLQGRMELFAYLSCPYELTLSNRDHTESLFSRLIAIWSKKSSGDEFEILGLQLQLLTAFLKKAHGGLQEKRQHDILRFKPVLDRIQANLAEPPSIPDLARLIHLNPSYFTRLFTEFFGVPPVRYILNERIRQAQLLLWQTHRTLDDIAGSLGFSDGFHLSKAFKKITGRSPALYRTQLHLQQP
jgi:AraC-like DNA-binding protein